MKSNLNSNIEMHFKILIKFKPCSMTEESGAHRPNKSTRVQ